MATVRELSVFLGFEVDAKPMKNFQNAFTGLVKQMGISSLTVAGVGTAFVKLVEGTSHYSDELEKASERIGISTTQLQELEFAAAKVADTSREELVTGLQFFTRVLGDARVGSKGAQEALARVGVTAQAFGGRMPTMSDALNQVADSLKAIDDPAVRASVAMDLFGRTGSIKLVQTFAKGSDGLRNLAEQANNLGFVLSEDVVKSGADFDQIMKDVRFSVMGLSRTIGNQLMPVATELLGLFRDLFLEDNKDFINALSAGMNAVGKAVLYTGKALLVMYKAATGFIRLLGGWERVATVVAYLAGAFAVGKLILGFGALAQAIPAVIAGMKSLNFMMVMANLTAAAMIAKVMLIGAAFIGLGLIIEDIYQFFTGGDSVIGTALKQIPALGQSFKNIFEPIFQPLVEAITFLIDGTQSWGMIFKKVGEIIVNTALLPLRSVLASVGALTGLAARFTGSAGLQQFSEGANKAASFATAQGIGDLAGRAANAAGQMVQNVTGNNTVNVTLSGDQSVNEVVPKIQQSVEDGMRNVIRQSSRNYASGVAY